MDDEVTLKHGAESDKTLDAELLSLLKGSSSLSEISERGGGEEWDAPFDLRVARPRATDLRAVWRATKMDVPPQLAGALGATRPILITHTVTPFPVDGRSPARVWSLAYELIAHNADANTVAVAPSNESYKVADLGQTVVLGIDVGGKFDVAELPGSNIGLRASTSQRFQFEVSMAITLRKVVGAPVGIGGAQWKMFRQNEPLDQPHTLLQLVLVPEHAQEVRCTVKTSATQAGWLGTHLGAKFWPYDDQMFTVKLA